MHEASLHWDNCFITLTYDDRHLPGDYSLNVKHFQDFMKRYRAWLNPPGVTEYLDKEKTIENPAFTKIKFYHAGEYGEACEDNNYIARPHYHAAIFGHDFDDKKLFKVRNGNRLYTSSALDDLWGMGHTSVGALTFESAAYVARYIMKKITGERADEYYISVCPYTGEIRDIEPEYSTMSRGGAKEGARGIGAGWYEQFKSDAYPSDFITVRGHPMKPPKYYDRLFEAENPEQMEVIKNERIEQMRFYASDRTPERLAVREQVKLAQISTLSRRLRS